MPILLGLIASVFIGVSDTTGRATSVRGADSVSHVATQMLVGIVVSVPVAFALGSEFIGRDVAAGAVSGVCVGLGLAVVYKGMAESSAAVVSPLAAVLAALVPLGWDLFSGTRLESLAAVGVCVAVASLALTTFNPDLGDGVRQGLIYGVVGGLFFGLSIAFAADTSEASGAWPAAMQRGTAFLSMLPLVALRKVPVFLPKGLRHFGLLGGIAGAIGMIAWVVGAQLGDLGTVSVVASTYPAMVTIASRFDGDQMRWWQAVGVLGAILGTALIAAA